MPRLRLFVAVEIPPDLKKELSQIVQKLSRVPGVKWVEPENLHLTLLFLGDQEETKIPDILYSLRESVEGQESFKIGLRGSGAFPNVKHPKIFFIPVDQGTKRLEKLAAGLSEGLRENKISFDLKPFQGHVTLGRSKTLKGLLVPFEMVEKLYSSFAREMNVEQFVLFQSRLTEKGPIYTALEKIKIGASK